MNVATGPTLRDSAWTPLARADADVASDVSPRERTEDERIDEAGEGSFPASDPPPWTLGREAHPTLDAHGTRPELMPTHAYPRDLALLVRERWAEVTVSDRDGAAGAEEAGVLLPDPPVLERLLSVCYQASLLHEEGRPVTFRVALAGPEAFAAASGPPVGLHRLVLSPSRPFDEHELSRLAPAALFQRSLVGVRLEGDGELRVWGLIHSGQRWLQALRGGRRFGQAIPPVLMVAMTGPGRVLVSRGTRTLAGLAGGTLANVATDVFTAPWLASLLADFRVDQPTEPAIPSEQSSAPRGRVDSALGPRLAEHALRRIVATIRGARHGGTLVILPAQSALALCADGRCLTLKYPFHDEEPRRRIPSIATAIMKQLAALHVGTASEAARHVGWPEYEASTDSRLAALDEALFEVAHFVATLANVDGAVVMTDQLEVLGFGAEIAGALPEVDSVDRSLDLEGTQRIQERTDRVGTRHRSSYRLCQHAHDALAIVVSQDGGVRFVRWQDGRVMYFDQIATGPWEV